MIREGNLAKMNTERNNVLSFDEEKRRLALAGKEPPTDENWLRALVPGTWFVAQDKLGDDARKLNLKRYAVVQHFTQTTILKHFVPDGRFIEVDVPTLEFSRFMKLWEIYFVSKMNEEEGQSNDPEDEQNGVAQPTSTGD